MHYCDSDCDRETAMQDLFLAKMHNYVQLPWLFFHFVLINGSNKRPSG